MKFVQILMILTFIAAPVFAETQTDTFEQLGVDMSGIKKLKTEDKSDRLETLKEMNKRPLWTDEQMDAMAKEQAKKRPMLDGPDIIYVIPLGM